MELRERSLAAFAFVHEKGLVLEKRTKTSTRTTQEKYLFTAQRFYLAPNSA